MKDQILISSCNLDNKVKKILKKHNINTIEDLYNIIKFNIYIREIGDKRRKELSNLLDYYGYKDIYIIKNRKISKILQDKKNFLYTKSFLIYKFNLDKAEVTKLNIAIEKYSFKFCDGDLKFELNLQNRIVIPLYRYGITCKNELLTAYNLGTLCKIREIGKKAINEIENAIKGDINNE